MLRVGVVFYTSGQCFHQMTCCFRTTCNHWVWPVTLHGS